jgi:hypothetical protein
MGNGGKNVAAVLLARNGGERRQYIYIEREREMGKHFMDDRTEKMRFVCGVALLRSREHGRPSYW